MTSQQTLDYILSYADHFDLRPHIQLSTQVCQVLRSPDQTQWRLSLLREGAEDVRGFDKVLFCTGRTHTPNIPQLKGVDLFRGEVIHSQAFKRSAFPCPFQRHR